MSELINAQRQRENFRSNLLTNISLLALLGYLGASPGAALAASGDDDPPAIWIQLGGQFEQMEGAHEIFAPPFLAKTPSADLDPMIEAQKPSRFSIGGEGKITFTPRDTNWVLSAAVRYGRSQSTRHDHQQTQVPYVKQYFGTQLFSQPGNNLFGDGQADSKETHAVLDFRAGKDVGLGLFGAGGKSVFSAGVRFAQFTSSASITLNARPDYKFGVAYSAHKYLANQHRSFGYRTVNHYRHTYGASLQTKRNTHAFGPSISWDASLPVVGKDPGMTVAVDWGVNAAVLFGRQHAQIHHQTTGHYFASIGHKFIKYPSRHSLTSSYAHGPFNPDRSRAVTIPNIGGFAGVTFQRSITKISMGYRADFFFGAMDNGIDTAKRANVGFYGPFATISIGLGG